MEDLKKRFVHHVTRYDERHGKVREKVEALADTINDLCLEGREKSLAITKLEECVMWADEAISRNE